MKKVLRIAAVLVVLTLFGSCADSSAAKKTADVGYSSEDGFASTVFFEQMTESDEFVRAVWISYIDISSLLSSGNYASSLEAAAKNLKTLRVTDVFFQVRSFGDALYRSSLFPSSFGTVIDVALEPDGDALEMAIECFHGFEINVHAWVNPYRLWNGGNEEYEAFLKDLEERDTLALTETENGVFLNPSNETARELIISGIKEILDDYDVDGIHLDDYFYPSSDEAVDDYSYGLYLEGGGALLLDEWRRGNTDALVKGIYEAVKQNDVELVFGVSPDSSIERNLSLHFIDVEKWCAEDGFVDYICPQIYFGFDNASMPFESTLDEWKDVAGDTPLIVGLAGYKAGAHDPYAGSGQNEWMENTDILAREYETVRENGCAGAAFFRYGSLFEPDPDYANSAAAETASLTVSIAKNK